MKKQLLSAVLSVALLGAGGIASAAESHDHSAAPAPKGQALITATGTVKSVDAAAGKLVIDHDPIPALSWPKMVMDFRLADKAMAGKVKAGDKVKFEMKQDEKGAYLITAIQLAL